MSRKNNSIVLGSLACIILVIITVWVFVLTFDQVSQSAEVSTSSMSSSQSESSSELETKDSQEAEVVVKSAEAKQAVMEADYDTMSALGLLYDYANLGLVEVVQVYMEEYGVDPAGVAFSYKNTKTGESFAMNETQPMTAGSTYKLPLNMLVVDEVAAGKYSLDEKFDISHTDHELESEYQSYMAQFGAGMTIPDMQEYSLVYSENTPAYALADRLGGMDEAYTKFGKYGQSKADIKTIQMEGNKTTTDYYIQVLDKLWQNQEKYADIIYFMEVSFPGQYYKTFLPDVRVVQKPGYVREALNVDAIVFEETPYLIALYTAGLGGSTEDSTEINGYGYHQLTQITYVINEWHRVNMN